MCSQPCTVADDRLGSAISCPRCRTRLQTAIGRYELRQKLGDGAFGTVYRALDPRLGREVAVKVLKPEALDSPQAIERFRREARAVARLKHPNIVTVFDHGQDGELHYIVYEFVQGRSLAEALPEGGLDARRAAELTAQVAEALACAHGQGVLHRDVKPANVMLDGKGQPVLVDFGLARQDTAQGQTITNSGDILGTPAYMAPEQFGGAGAGPASDQYSLGVTLYQLLTGKLPFIGPLQAVIGQILYADPPPPGDRRPGLDPRLAAICLTAMAKEPKERHADCGALAGALRQWLAPVAVVGPSPPLPDTLPDADLPDRRELDRRRLTAAKWVGIVLAVSALLVLVAVLGSGSWRPRDAERERDKDGLVQGRDGASTDREKDAGARDADKDKETAAKAKAKVIEQAALVFYLQNDRFPNDVTELTRPDPNNENKPLLLPDAILDPWRQVYVLDPLGTNNKGDKPDVFTINPITRKVIGNWDR
jgi:tRNA A-37 threonylcarbamoyl transferase component Bud32